MKTRFLIILTFSILLIISLTIVSYWEKIEKEIWNITGEYSSGAAPTFCYDYSMMYAIVLVVFWIIGSIIFGMSLVLREKFNP